MMNTNLRNFGTAEGNVALPVKVFAHKDGSIGVKVRLAVRNNYKNAEGKYDSEFLDFDGFIPKPGDGDTRTADERLGVYSALHVGDRIGIMYALRANDPYEKDGVKIYEQVAAIKGIDLKESKSTTDARAKSKEQTVPVEQGAAPVVQGDIPAVPDDSAEEKPFKDDKKKK